MRVKRDPEQVEAQVLQAIRDFKRDGKIANEYQLLHYCKKNMFGIWSIGKVQKAVKRLEQKKKIKTCSLMRGGRACLIVELI